MSDRYDARALRDAAIVLRARNRRFMTEVLARTLNGIADDIETKEYEDEQCRSRVYNQALENWKAEAKASKSRQVDQEGTGRKKEDA